MTRFLALPILIGLLLIAAPRASAQGVVDQSNATGALLFRSDIKPTAQSFTVGRSGSLVGADLWVTKQGTGTNMTVSVEALKANGYPDGVTLATATVSTDGMQRVNFQPRRYLLAGARYALVFREPGTNYALAATSNLYAGGGMLNGNLTGDWTTAGPYDYMFRTYIDPDSDRNAPRSTFDLTVTPGAGDWARAVTLGARVEDNLSGVAETRCWVDPQEPVVYDTPGSRSCSGSLADGVHQLYVASRDNAGNVERPVWTFAMVDATPPVSTLTGVSGDWTAAPPAATLTALDPASGVQEIRYSVGANPGAPTTHYDKGLPPHVGDGEKINYAAVDVAGNVESARTSAAVKIDSTPPVTYLSGFNPRYTSSPQAITLLRADSQSGVAATYYSTGANPGTPDKEYNPPSPPVLQDGERIRFYTVDRVGNRDDEQISAPAKIDPVPPVTTLSGLVSDHYTTPQTVTLSAADALSGIARTYYSIGANPGPATQIYAPAHPPVLQDGERIRYYSVDLAGNAEPSRLSAPAKVDATAPTTTASEVDAGYTTAPQEMTLTAADAKSGVAATYYSIGASPEPPTTVYDPASKPKLGDGERIRFHSVDVAGNVEADVTSPAAKVDGTVPDTVFDTAPEADTADALPQLRFSSAAVDPGFECALDGADFAACNSPYTPAQPLADGAHTFTVRAVSRAGVVDPSPATATFTVDTVAPAAPAIDARPDATTTATSATFGFASEARATFACALDGGPATACTSPLTLTGLAVGGHTLTVAARDRVGNAGPTTTATWTVTPPPEPTVEATPVPQPGTPEPTPVPAPTSTPTPTAVTLKPTVTLAPKLAQQLAGKNGIPIRVGCGEAACKATIAVELRAPGKKTIKLKTQKTSVPAGGVKAVRFATTAKQRAQLRKLGKKATLRYTITVIGPDGKTTKRSGTIAL